MPRPSCFLGLVLLLALGGCGGGGGTTTNGGSPPDLADVAVYAADSPYALVLKECATATAEADLCTLATLPLIGAAAPDPTVADVMDRVLVSHPWMGERFAQVLEQLPPDLLILFKGVTAVVIDADIRPSYYDAGNAALYLDPADLWLTNEEKATISQAPDYRNDFGAQLQFVPLTRYVLGDSYAYSYYPLDGTATRQLSDILYPMARLLYHELAHANDYLPPALQPGLDPQLTPYRAELSVAADSVAAHLYAVSPLTSGFWKDLGRVLYAGVPPSTEQLGYSAAQVGSEFAADVAGDPYGYSTAHEDVAMLFEATMMKYHFGIDRDTAFTDRPATATPACDDYLVQWGVRRRIGDPAVKPRAAQVAAELLPGSDLGAFFAALPAPTPLVDGQGWCANLGIGTVYSPGAGAGPGDSRRADKGGSASGGMTRESECRRHARIASDKV